MKMDERERKISPRLANSATLLLGLNGKRNINHNWLNTLLGRGNKKPEG